MRKNAWLRDDSGYRWETKVNSDWIIRELQIVKKDSVLDIGCGTGAHLDDIQRKIGCKCIGVDIRDDLFKLNKNKKLVLKFSDMRHLKIPDSSMTKVFSLGVFEHVPETEKVFDEVKRVLKRDGKVLFSVPNKISMFHITKKIKQALGLWKLGYEASFTIKRLKRMLEKKGFYIEKAYIVPHGRVSNPFNLVDNLMNKVNNKKFGFFITIVARKIR